MNNSVYFRIVSCRVNWEARGNSQWASEGGGLRNVGLMKACFASPGVVNTVCGGRSDGQGGNDVIRYQCCPNSE